MPSALGTCADMGLDEVMGNQMADDFAIAQKNPVLGAHCVLVHDLLWPHKARLLQIAREHLAAAGYTSPSAAGPLPSKDNRIEACQMHAVPGQLLRSAVMELVAEHHDSLATAPLGVGTLLDGFSCCAPPACKPHCPRRASPSERA